MALLLASTTANAGMIRDVVSQVDMLGWGDEVTRTHDLTSDVAEGDEFDPNGTIDIIDGTFSMFYIDDNYDGEANVVLWNFTNSSDPAEGGAVFQSGGDIENDLSPDVIIQLNDTGILDVTIWSEMGDFKVLDTEVFVNTTSAAAASVPEPGVLVLLGLGLVGLRAARPRA